MTRNANVNANESARRRTWAMLMVSALAACTAGHGGAASQDDPGGDPAGTPSGTPPTGANPGDPGSPAPAGGPGGDVYKAIYDAVDPDRLVQLLNDMTGGNPVTVGGQTFSIAERYSPAGKASYRAYWKQYYEALGMTTKEIPFDVPNLVGETTGTDLEAILPGDSPDSVVVTVHYDSTGKKGKETENPAVDDQMTGMAMQMELARILVAQKQRHNTIRFAAPDYEEISDSLAGDLAYMRYVRGLSQSQGFSLVAAVDDDQSGWSCWNEGTCPETADAPKNMTISFSSCSGPGGEGGDYDYPALRDGFIAFAKTYSPLTVHTECDPDYDADMSPFALVNVPSMYIEEYDQGDNPHYDDTGDDTMEHIAKDYFVLIARVGVAFEASLVGVGGDAGTTTHHFTGGASLPEPKTLPPRSRDPRARRHGRRGSPGG